MKLLRKFLYSWYKSDSSIKRGIALMLASIFYLAFQTDYSKITSVKKKMVANNICENSFKTNIDMLFSLLFSGFSPDDYSSYNLISKTSKQRKTFASSVEDILFGSSINDFVFPDILSDKKQTYDIFKKYFKRDLIVVKDKADYDLFVSFSKNHKKFFCKPQCGSCGRNSGVIDLDEEDPSSTFKKLISTGPYVLEELIKQSSVMSQFNESSINTVRTTLVRTENGIELLFGFIRCGRKGQCVDNGGAGGIIIPYNPNNGYLSKIGFDEVGVFYNEHPDSGVKFEGFQIPCFNEIIKLSFELAQQLPNYNYYGWDIAITDNGLILVEGNSRPQLIGLQGIHVEGFKQEIYTILHERVIPDSLRKKQMELFC